MKNTLLIIAAFVTAIAFTACRKDVQLVHATIVDSGDITNEGCGYLLQLNDSSLVKPTYLPSSYQHHGYKVIVKYKHTGIVDTCDFANKLFDRANIIEIDKDQD